jgi:hypothetical protein
MIQVGSDPEIFLKNGQGKLVSAINTVGGTKKFPRPIAGGSVQEDNVLLEFNTIPASTCDEFVRNHINIMKSISEIPVLKGLELSIQATGEFDEDELSHPSARRAGCEPDFNAWTMSINSPPDLSSTNLRSGAGHLHISTDWMGDERNREGAVERCNLVKALDIALGIPSVLMDDDKVRRTLYGKAGCHRPKFLSYGDKYNGLEYRTLSNFWLKTEEMMRWAFENVEYAVSQTNEWVHELNKDKRLADAVQQTINGSNEGMAIDLAGHFNLEVLVDV